MTYALWHWFTTREEDKTNELQLAVEQNKTATAYSIQTSKRSKEKASKLLNVSQNALDILSKAEKQK